MKIGEFVEYFSSVLDNPLSRSIPRLILGPPGIGKTASLKYIANKHNIKVITIDLTRKKPEHLEGIPLPQSTITYEGKPIFLKLLPDFLKGIDDNSMLVFEHITEAHQDILNATLTIFAERQINFKLPDATILVATGHPISSSETAHPLVSSITTRFQTIYIEPDFQWLLTTGIAKELYHDSVIKFLSENPEFFFTNNAIDPTNTGTVSQNITPKLWEIVSKLISAGQYELVKSVLGPIWVYLKEYLQ